MCADGAARPGRSVPPSLNQTGAAARRATRRPERGEAPPTAVYHREPQVSTSKSTRETPPTSTSLTRLDGRTIAPTSASGSIRRAPARSPLRTRLTAHRSLAPVAGRPAARRRGATRLVALRCRAAELQVPGAGGALAVTAASVMPACRPARWRSPRRSRPTRGAPAGGCRRSRSRWTRRAGRW